MVAGNIFKAPPDKARWELPIHLFPWSHTLETAKEAQAASEKVHNQHFFVWAHCYVPNLFQGGKYD
jgi:hypothetical protein